LLRDGAKQLGDEPEAFEGRADDSLLMDRPARDFSLDTGSGRRMMAAGKFGRDFVPATHVADREPVEALTG
jgi:hypothetical protein